MRKASFLSLGYQYISGLLIILLLFSETIRVDFFDRVQASPEKHRDIVSVYVDKATDNAVHDKIVTYAHDIE
jgi:hypothetical protein